MAFDLTSLISYWPMSEFSDGTGAITRADLHGTNTLNDPFTTPSAAGLVYANALDCSGAEGLYDDNNASLQMGLIDFTICAWVKLKSKTTAHSYVSKGHALNDSYRLQYNPVVDGFQMYAWGAVGETDQTAVQATTFGVPSTGVNYLLIGGYELDIKQTFISVNAGTVDLSGTPNVNGAYIETGEFDIGFTDNLTVHFADAVIGPVLLWKRLLTAQEKTDLYNGGAGLTYAAMSGSGSTFLLVRP